MKAAKKLKKSQNAGPLRQSTRLHTERVKRKRMLKAGHNPTQVQSEIRGARRSGTIDEEQKRAIEAAMMEGSDSESSIIPDSEPEEDLLAMPSVESQTTTQVLCDFREMFEGTQPSFMQDTLDEEGGYASSVGSVHIRSEESGSDESGGYTDSGDSDKENQDPMEVSTRPTTPAQSPPFHLPNSPLKPSKRGRLRHIETQAGISASETDSDNLTNVCEYPSTSKITQAFAILEEEQQWHKRTVDRMLKAERNCDRETRRVEQLEKKLDEKNKQLEAKDKELEQFKIDFAVVVSFVDKYRATHVDN